MNAFKQTIFDTIKLLIFWVLLFDIERILFSIHNWNKFSNVNIGEWLLAFVYSFRLDMATAAALSILPLLILVFRFIIPGKWFRPFFFTVFAIEILQNGIIN